MNQGLSRLSDAELRAELLAAGFGLAEIEGLLRADAVDAIPLLMRSDEVTHDEHDSSGGTGISRRGDTLRSRHPPGIPTVVCTDGDGDAGPGR